MESGPVPAEGQISPIARMAGLMAPPNDRSIKNQAGQLKDARFPVVQRQAVATRINNTYPCQLNYFTNILDSFLHTRYIVKSM
jgi:hypothetical protein